MKVAALFICADDHLYDAVNTNKERLIPRELRLRWRSMSFSVIPLQIPIGASEFECISHIEAAIQGFEGIALLIPPQFKSPLARCRTAFFAIDYVPPQYSQNLQNQTAKLLNKTLGDLSVLLSRSAEMKYRRSLLLPINDFMAPVMDSMRVLFDDLSSENQFARTLDKILSDFRRLQVPTRVADDEIHPVYVDSKYKRFDRGRERHAEAGDSIPPHEALCGLNKKFRFGFRYEEKLHFNVTVKGDVRDHNFASCHPPHHATRIKRATHANLFPNGYVT